MPEVNSNNSLLLEAQESNEITLTNSTNEITLKSKVNTCNKNLINLKSNALQKYVNIPKPLYNKGSANSNASIKSSSHSMNKAKTCVSVNNTKNLLYYNQNNSEAEFKLTPNSLIEKEKNYYQASELLLVPLPEIQQQGDKVYYITDDNVSGSRKQIFKSVVLTSSKKIEEDKLKNKVSKPWVWDNKHLFEKIQEKKSMLQKALIGNKFSEIFSKYVSRAIYAKVNKSVVVKSIAAFIAMLLVQLAVNRGMRRYSLSFLKSLVFLCTSMATSYGVYIVLTNYVIDQNHLEALPSEEKLKDVESKDKSQENNTNSNQNNS